MHKQFSLMSWIFFWIFFWIKNILKIQKKKKMMMSSLHENSKDWFEFILDLDLLDNHFKQDNSTITTNNGIQSLATVFY